MQHFVSAVYGQPMRNGKNQRVDGRSVRDVIIVGGGPAGLSAGLVLARCCRTVLVIDNRQPRNAVASHMHGYLGYDGAEPSDLRRKGEAEVRGYGAEILSDFVVDAWPLPEAESTRPTSLFSVRMQSGREESCRKLLLATGVRDELPAILGFEECFGESVFHCPYCDGWECQGKRLAAFSEKTESASQLALKLKAWSPNISIFTNGNEVDAKTRLRMDLNGIVVYGGKVASVLHSSGKIRAVLLESGEEVAIEGLFFSAGQQPQSLLPRRLGCSMDGSRQRSSENQRTDVHGVYVAGDADKRAHFAIVAAAEGAIAAVAINEDLQREASL